MLLQVWNHPWVLKLDTDRRIEREERRRLFEESEEEGDTLNGFIVSGSEEEEEEEENEDEENGIVTDNIMEGSSRSQTKSNRVSEVAEILE